MQIQDISKEDLQLIIQLGTIYEYDALKDFGYFLIQVSHMENWATEYTSWHKEYEMKEYLQSYDDADEEMDELITSVFWTTFLLCNGGTKLAEYLIYYKDKPCCEISSIVKDIDLSVIAKRLNIIAKARAGRAASSIQFRTIDEETFIKRIRRVIKEERPKAKGTDTRAMFETLQTLNEIQTQYFSFHKWIAANISEHNWGNEQRNLSCKSEDKDIPYYSKIIKSLKNTKKF